MPNFIEIGGGSRKFSKKLVDLTRNDPMLEKWRTGCGPKCSTEAIKDLKMLLAKGRKNITSNSHSIATYSAYHAIIKLYSMKVAPV